MITGPTGKNQNKTPRHGDAKEISGFEVDLPRIPRAQRLPCRYGLQRVRLRKAAGMPLLLVGELFLDQLLKSVFDCRLIEALYAHRDALGAPTFDAALRRVRATLRARVDRQMEYAG